MEGTTDVAMTTKIPSFTDGTCLALCTVPQWTASGSGWVGSVRWPHLPMDAALAGWRSENGGWGLTGCWIRGPVWSWRGRTWAGCRASWGVISRTDYPDTLPGQPRGTQGGGGLAAQDGNAAGHGRLGDYQLPISAADCRCWLQSLLAYD